MSLELQVEYDSAKFHLTAINVLLQMINQLPIEDEIQLNYVLEAKVAASVLLETKTEVLSDEWDFNRDENYSFPPDLSGYINIPANILDIYDTQGNIIMRDWRLYNKTSQSAKFDEAQNMNVVWNVDFNSLTHPLRNYITIRAARKFQARQVMDTNLYRFSQEEEEAALMIARRSEARTGNYNMLTSTFGSQAGAR